MKSKDEIQRILYHSDLDGNSVLSVTLQDRTKKENVDQAKQRSLSYHDYNNRKCLTKMAILSTFLDTFCTSRGIDEREAKPRGGVDAPLS